MDNINRIMNAVDFIEKNLKNNITIKEVASAFYVSNFYLHKLFQLFTGDSPGQFLIKRRLYQAAIELKEHKLK